jgi:hypothetical protein
MTDDAKSIESATGMEIESSVTVGETLVEAKIDPVTALQDSIGK